MSGILKRFGLTKADVARISGNTPVASNSVVTTHRETSTSYWYGPDQQRIRKRLAHHERWVVAQFVVMGRAPALIASILGVSEESVRRRLRKCALFNSHGKSGRPFTRPPI